MMAIIEKVYTVEKIIGDVSFGNKVVKDCIGIDKKTLIIKFLSIPIYRKSEIFNEIEAKPKQNHISDMK